ARDHQGAAQELKAAMAAGQHAACATLAHRLRGAAANLGMERLADALWHLERALQAPDARAELPALLELAIQRLSEALAAVWAQDAAGQKAEAATPSAAKGLLPLDLERVRALGE